jgi:hypothetical protein
VLKPKVSILKLNQKSKELILGIFITNSEQRTASMHLVLLRRKHEITSWWFGIGKLRRANSCNIYARQVQS